MNIYIKLVWLTGWVYCVPMLLSSCSTTYIQAHYHPDPIVFLCSTANRNPEFTGSTNSLFAYISQHKLYPKRATQSGVTGRVFVGFIVGKDGQISEVTVLKGLGYGCDGEAIRLVSTMLRWILGKANDEYVSVKYNIPISFGMND